MFIARLAGKDSLAPQEPNVAGDCFAPLELAELFIVVLLLFTFALRDQDPTILTSLC